MRATPEAWRRTHRVVVLAAAISVGGAVALWGDRSTAADPTAEPVGQRGADIESQEKADYRTAVYRGRVTFLSEALARRHGIATAPGAEENTLVLETSAGGMMPIVEDARGRAFRVDPRLRAMEVKLLARHFDASPIVQVVRVFEVSDGVDLEIDYWCEICAIAMYQLKACDCCQGPIELRKRPRQDPFPTTDPSRRAE